MPVKHQTDLQQLKERHHLAEVAAASGVALRGRGRVLQGPCPFHDEREPSFTVYQDTQRYYCFGCGAKGDVLDFLQRRDGLTLPEAIDRLGGPLPAAVPRQPTPKAATEVRPSLPDPALLSAAMRFYTGALWRSQDGLAYLKKRGIRPRTAMRLGLGYSSGRGLREHLTQLGFPIERVDRSGLFIGQRERFSGKVVVPEITHGRVTWLIGRGVNGGHPRFQALPGTKPLLGLGRLHNPEAVVVTEGLFDWLTLAQWGIPACALLGTHGIERHLPVLTRIQRVYLAFDNDPAGRGAAEAAAALLGPKAATVYLPAGVKDLADLALHPHGRSMFLRLLTQARQRMATGTVQGNDTIRTTEGRF